MNADHVDLAAAEMLRVLTPLEDADWRAAAGTLEWTCLETAAHVGHDLIAYATQLTARAPDAYLPLDLVVQPGVTPAQTLRIAGACAGLLSAALRTTPADARAWHWGPTDPSGFAALGVNEILNHTYDIASGLGAGWTPPAELSALVLARLFPDAPVRAAETPPAEVLLWCTGRVSLPDRPRRTSWQLKASL